MTDYTKTDGGTIMIRDTGSTVEFWFKARDSSDWVNGLDFNWTANGSTTSKSINYPTGADWYHVGTVTITSSQTVTFRLTSNTSIGGIGGPISLSQYIKRADNPSPPSTPSISGITSTSVVVTFTDGSNGGARIDSRQIGYGTSSSSPQYTTSSDGSTTIGALHPGTRYYFWARTHNSEGYSGWSGRATAVTIKVPDAPTKPLLSSVTGTTVDVAFSANGNGGASITAYEIGYGTNSSAPVSTVSASSPQVVTGLTPGTTYYFFVRAKNSVGWSPWSTAASARTVSGAYIKVGPVWKLAVPYVNVGGVWKVAELWCRSVGVWNRTT